MLLIKNISRIVGIDESGRQRVEGAEMASLGTLDNAWLLADGDKIVDYGSMDELPAEMSEANTSPCATPSLAATVSPEPTHSRSEAAQLRRFVFASDTEIIDAEGGMVFPSFCDSHTHLVYAGSREGEFVDKINGLTYEEIARRGGGILNSADRLHHTSEDELYVQAMERVGEIIKMGTGAVEIKSGYGLTLPDELKMLRVIRRIKESSPLTVRARVHTPFRAPIADDRPSTSTI